MIRYSQPFLPGEVLIDEIFQPDATDEVVQARGLSGAEEVPGHPGQVRAHRRGGLVRVPQPEGGHDLLVVPPVFIPPVRRGAAPLQVTPHPPVPGPLHFRVQLDQERADAVPATRQMFATTPNLALVIGVTSDEAASVVPVINADKMVVFGMTGQSEFDSTHFQYFYQLVPPDLEESYAMIVIAQQLGYKRIALAFGNDIGSQTFISPAVSAISKAGMTLAANETLDLSASTFRTEADKIVAAHPDVILTEALGPADATFLSEVKQLNGGKMIPVIGTSATISPDWYKSVAVAIGASTLASSYHADNLVTETSGPAYTPFYNAIMSEQGKVGSTGNFSTYLTAPGAVHLYDGINLAALAMVEAKSTVPSVYAPYIAKIGDGAPGAVTVCSYAQGVAALKQGKAIRYEGPGGPTSFDSYNDSTGIFQTDTYSASGAVQVAGNITAAQLRAVS